MEKIEIFHAEAVEAINRSEIDVQIKTAKAYPRNIQQSLQRIEEHATSDQETADDCHYSLPRAGKQIEGPSVRFAEICANAWGNMRIATQLVANDGKMVTVRGVCHDLETNVAYMDEAHISILDKNGNRFNADLQLMAAKRGASVALRNAIFRAIPEHMTKKIQEKVRQAAIGKALDLPTAINNMVASFAKIGVSQEQILAHLGIKAISEIDKEKLHAIRGTWNAIKQGEISVDDVFPKTTEKTGDDKKADLKKKRDAGKKEEGKTETTAGEKKEETATGEKKEGETKPEVKPGEQGKIDLP